jgi:hypothetical protein
MSIFHHEYFSILKEMVFGTRERWVAMEMGRNGDGGKSRKEWACCKTKKLFSVDVLIDT